MANDQDKNSPGFAENSRRDFVGGTLIGSGVALLAAQAPGLMAQGVSATGYQLEMGRTIGLPLTGLDESWTGPGGVGDYAFANGDTYHAPDLGRH